MITPSTQRPLHVAVRCDATQHGGVGHLVRQLALAEELIARGHRVTLWGTCEVPWAQRQAAERGLAFVEPPAGPHDLTARLLAERVDVLIIDGYAFDPVLGTTARAAGVGVLTLCDGEFGLDQDADVYVDQNLGAHAAQERHPDAEFLVGLDYVLLRDVVRDRRGVRREALPAGDAPRVLVVFGGTDAYGGCRVLVPLLLATDAPVEVVAIAARREVADELAALKCGPGQRVTVLPTADDLPGIAVGCDAAVSASGTSVWEFLCLGVPMALVCVTDNQLLGYREATHDELCLPAGKLTALREDAGSRAASVAQLTRLLEDPALRERLASRGRGLVDGRGRERVADAVERLALR
ncbi:PseG/SpsG family protein [Nigerium massiliense]|uniref:PseG/SpsG family protein n=1 Tax=Nigerium massiliense TaxID=1522317 RepID=UPI000590A59C|nr:hypothetical protein [Nigerium massiliense]